MKSVKNIVVIHSHMFRCLGQIGTYERKKCEMLMRKYEGKDSLEDMATDDSNI